MVLGFLESWIRPYKLFPVVFKLEVKHNVKVPIYLQFVRRILQCCFTVKTAYLVEDKTTTSSPLA